MTKEFFGKQVDRLRNVYSAAALNPERIEILWERFKRVPEEQFHGAVTFLIGEFTTQALPSISRFDEALARFRPRVEAQNDTYREAQFTHAPCRDFGWVFDGDLIVHCTCLKSKSVSWEDLKREQENYDRGRRFFTKEKLSAIFNAAKKGELERSRT